MTRTCSSRRSARAGARPAKWAIWEALYGLVATDGYPRPVWDPFTGTIDREVPSYWRERYDLADYLKRNWSTLGPKLTGRLHVAVGATDSFYLEQAVYLLQQVLAAATDPPRQRHLRVRCAQAALLDRYSREQPGEDLSQAEFVRIVTEYLKR